MKAPSRGPSTSLGPQHCWVAVPRPTHVQEVLTRGMQRRARVDLNEDRMEVSSVSIKGAGGRPKITCTQDVHSAARGGLRQSNNVLCPQQHTVQTHHIMLDTAINLIWTLQICPSCAVPWFVTPLAAAIMPFSGAVERNRSKQGPFCF